jgi:hypothetical protein
MDPDRVQEEQQSLVVEVAIDPGPGLAALSGLARPSRRRLPPTG